MQNPNLILLIIIGYVSFFFGVELIYKKYHLPREMSRKIAHICSGLGALLLYQVLSQSGFLAIAIILLTLLAFTRRTQLFTSFQTSRRKTYGDLTYPVGIICLAYWYNQFPIFAVGVLIMSIADPLASLAGWKISPQSKTHLGSVLFFAASFLLLLSILPTVTALSFAILLTIVELVSPYGSDNTTVPLTYTLLFYLLQS